MRKILKYIEIISFSIFVTIFTYYTYAVFEARDYTQHVILEDIKKNQWRPLNGDPEQFDVGSGELTERQRKILIKVQDPGFYNHHGIDLSTPGAGLTTITQAIVKKLYFEKFTPGIAKIKQSIIARFVVDGLISKEEQLTLFLNSMYFGNVANRPLTGIAEAAEAYYQKSVNNLTDDQYISLIAILVMPGTFHILDHPEWNKDRANRIKALMGGKYTPKGLMDQFYGDLPKEVLEAGVPPASYFGEDK